MEIPQKRENFSALFADFEAYEKNDGLAEMTQKFKILNFFFQCKIISDQNFESYTTLERTERPLRGSKMVQIWPKLWKIVQI